MIKNNLKNMLDTDFIYDGNGDRYRCRAGYYGYVGRYYGYGVGSYGYSPGYGDGEYGATIHFNGSSCGYSYTRNNGLVVGLY